MGGIALLSAAPLAFQAVVGGTAVAAQDTRGHGHDWVGAWASSVVAAPPADLINPGNKVVVGFDNETIRQIVHTSAAGQSVRLHISNAFGTKNLSIGKVTVGIQKSEADLTTAPTAVSFHGSSSTVIPQGHEAVTDPVNLNVPAGTDLAVSIYVKDASGPATNHSLAIEYNYYSSGNGDFTGDVSGKAYGQSDGTWFFLSAVDVRPAAHTGAVVAFGDDLTDGFGADFNANNRWTDDLAVRLQQAGHPMGVLDEGIAGNRLLHDSPCFGKSGLARLHNDVLNQTGVRAVILHQGMNDLGYSQLPDSPCFAPRTAANAAQLITGYLQVIAALHARGVRAIGATLTPMGGSPFFTAENEKTRQEVNAWIRYGHAFDGVVDFDKAVRDPANPEQLLAAYDWGDHLHPSKDGYKAMADAIDLRLLGADH